MIKSLEIYIDNNIQYIIPEELDPIQLIFTDETGKVTEHSFITLSDLEKILAARTDEIMSRPTHEPPPASESA